MIAADVTDPGSILDRASRPDLWLGTAEMLLRAADQMPVASLDGMAAHRKWLLDRERAFAGSFITHLVLPSLGLFPARMMLLGLALENLAKGLIVAANPSAVRPNGDTVEFPWGRRHLSTELLRQAGHQPTPEDEELLEILAEFVLWAGRFPAPLRAPEAEQRWDTPLETRYRDLADTLRLGLKMSIRSDQRLVVENGFESVSRLSITTASVCLKASTILPSLWWVSPANAGRSSTSRLGTRPQSVSASASTSVA
jgi:hypothetical protein